LTHAIPVLNITTYAFATASTAFRQHAIRLLPGMMNVNVWVSIAEKTEMLNMIAHA
jgi:hypothetical protein